MSRQKSKAKDLNVLDHMLQSYQVHYIKYTTNKLLIGFKLKWILQFHKHLTKRVCQIIVLVNTDYQFSLGPNVKCTQYINKYKA